MESYIILSHLNDFVFCPRSIYYHQLYSTYNEQFYKATAQIAGTEAHSTIDNKLYSTKKSILQGIEVFSAKYNIVGKIDVFEMEAGRLMERKRQIKKIYDGYIFQVYAQYFALSEMGYRVQEIIIQDLLHNKNHEIVLPENNPSMFEKFERIIHQIQTFDLNDGEFRAHKEKCSQCIYSALCDKSVC